MQRFGIRLRHRRRALTLAEMAVSVVLVGVMLVAALNVVGAAKHGERTTADRQRGLQLAEDLMAEILEQDYADSSDGPDSFGRSSDESSTGDRSLFDDVDDYAGWSAQPPQAKAGTVITYLPDWQRTVTVEWVDPSDPSTAVGTNLGVKRITVTAACDGIPMAELVALRTSGPSEAELCCLPNGISVDLDPSICTAICGAPGGPGSSTWNTSCPNVCEIYAGRDTYIRAKAPLNNYGAASNLIVDRESTDLQRALLWFDLGEIPSNAPIVRATLTMQATQIDGKLNILIYQVNRAWVEGSGNGTMGTANWSLCQSGVAWASAGGDYKASSAATLTTGATGPHTWDVTSLVQSWVAGSSPNYGVMVASPDGGGNRTVTYDSREGTTPPRLTIEYGQCGG